MAVVRIDQHNVANSQDAIAAVLERGGTSEIRELCITGLLCEEDIDDISDVLRRNNSLNLQVLKLQRNFLTASSCHALALVLQSVPTLRELDVSENRLGEFSEKMFLTRRESTESMSSQQSRGSRGSSGRLRTSLTGDGLVKLVEALALPSCSLVTLQLKSNKLGPKAATALTGLIRRASSIRHLDLGDNSLGTKTIKSLVSSLLHNSTLERLDLSYNHISDRGASMLAAVLDASPDSPSQNRLQELNLTFNKIGQAGASSLAHALLSNRTLRKLDLSLNHIGPEGAKHFGPVLKYSHTLQELILTRNNIGEGTEGVLRFLEGLQESDGTQLHVLDLSWNSLTDEAALLLAQILSGNSQLRSLNLSSNAIGTRGILALADALVYDVGLQELNIVGNQADNKSAEALAKVLCRPCSAHLKLHWEQNNFSAIGKRRIESALAFRRNRSTWLGRILRDVEIYRVIGLDLDKFVLGDDELVALSSHLRHHLPVVRVLRVKGTMVTGRAASALARQVLAPNLVKLERLYLHRTSIKDHGAAALAQSLLTNTSLRILSLVSCGITAEGAKMLANALRSNSRVTTVNLQGNAIGDVGAKELLAAVLESPRPTLKSLNLSCTCLSDGGLCLPGRFTSLESLFLIHNHITDSGALDLAKACIGTCSLKWLDVSYNHLTHKGIQTLQLFLPLPTSVLHSNPQTPAPTIATTMVNGTHP